MLLGLRGLVRFGAAGDLLRRPKDALRCRCRRQLLLPSQPGCRSIVPASPGMTRHEEPIEQHATRTNTAARLPDAAVIARGGESSPPTLHKSALAEHDDSGTLGISAVSRPDMTADEIAFLGEIPHPKLRETTVGALRAAGYDVIPDEPPPGHALITLPAIPADEDYVAISDLFGPTRPNPAFRKERK